MSTVREIVQAAMAAGVVSPPQVTALVALVQADAGGDAGKAAQHAAKAKRYPTGWSLGDHARHGARIALLTPQVTAALLQLGPAAIPEAAEVIVDAAAAPIVAIAREPLRVLAWATDPGTVVRFVKVAIGAALVVGGLYLAVQPRISRTLVQGAGTAIKARTGRTGAAA